MSREDDELREKLSDASRDDGRVWGFLLDNGIFIRLPKTPLLLAGLGPPPFDVTLPSGDIRHVVHQPGSAHEPDHPMTTAPPVRPATGGSTSGAD